jgi:hypothetical protein
VDLFLILAGPILRRVEPNLVAVWVALSLACTVRLPLWENQIEASDAEDTNLWFGSLITADINAHPYLRYHVDQKKSDILGRAFGKFPREPGL